MLSGCTLPWLKASCRWTTSRTHSTRRLSTTSLLSAWERKTDPSSTCSRTRSRCLECSPFTACSQTCRWTCPSSTLAIATMRRPTLCSTSCFFSATQRNQKRNTMTIASMVNLLLADSCRKSLSRWIPHPKTGLTRKSKLTERLSFWFLCSLRFASRQKWQSAGKLWDESTRNLLTRLCELLSSKNLSFSTTFWISRKFISKKDNSLTLNERKS